MKTAEIVTTHNVVIQYEMAPVMLRGIAQLLDWIIIVTYSFLMLLLFSSLIVSFRYDNLNDVWVLVYYLMLLPVFFYSFFMEALFGGQTIGKMALGIRVLKADGSNPSLGDLFLRWSFRLIDIVISLGTMALLVALSNEKSQRLGDAVSDTIVIKLKPKNDFSITDILKIKSTKDYKPDYPQVLNFSDNDMLLVKNALERLRKTPNDHHKNLVRDLVATTCEKLQIPIVEKGKISFLKQVLQDYIVLTRS